MNPENMTDEQITRVLAEMKGYDMSLVFDTMKDGTLWMEDGEYETTFNPLADANDTLMVIEALQGRGINMQAGTRYSRGFYARCIWNIYGDPWPEEVADTFQRAVCYTAVKAIASCS